jgi:hypothetical protein
MLSSHLRLGLLRASQPKPCKHLSPLPCIISFINSWKFTEKRMCISTFRSTCSDGICNRRNLHIHWRSDKGTERGAVDIQYIIHVSFTSSRLLLPSAFTSEDTFLPLAVDLLTSSGAETIDP